MKFVNDTFCKEVLQRLVRINSCQPKGNEKEVVETILSYFPKDIEKEIIDHGNDRQTLIIKIKGESETGGVAFVGHTDTVAYGDMSRWTFAPLEAHEHNGYISGRGTADMKGGDTSMIATALEIRGLLFLAGNTEEAWGFPSFFLDCILSLCSKYFCAKE